MTTTFKRMDVVMVKDHLAEEWHLGLVNQDFNPGDFGVICKNLEILFCGRLGEVGTGEWVHIPTATLSAGEVLFF